MTAPETATFSQFAVIAGYKPGYITALRKDGRLVLTEDGKRVKVAESIQLIKDTKDPARIAVA
ncbi:MAG: terminase small subunit, partial [Steroidobacteraceae bacterium]